VLRELGLSFSYADGSGYKVLALLIDPPGTIIGPEGGWGLPHTLAKMCILIKNSEKVAGAIPSSFSYTLVANLPTCIISRNHFSIKRSGFFQVFRFFFFLLLLLLCFAEMLEVQSECRHKPWGILPHNFGMFLRFAVDLAILRLATNMFQVFSEI
jgi:hypothetical protein